LVAETIFYTSLGGTC